MKRELSKDEKIQLGAKIFCGVLCVSLIGGTIGYYRLNEIKAQKQVAYEIENGLNGYDPIDEVNNEELAEIDKNINFADSSQRPAGYDKFGKKYTFKDNGLGEPVEKPDIKKAVSVTNPNTGIKYAINTASWEWHVNDRDKVQAEIDRQQNRVVGGESHWTDEQIDQAMKSMKINLGTMD